MKILKWVIALFIPHSDNNYKARLLHPASLSVLVAFFLTWQFFLNYFTVISPAVLGFASNIIPEEVIKFTNKERLEQGLSPLKSNDLLNEVARRKAADMFSFNYWAHVSPSGRDPWSFFKEVGYKYIYAGENLARDFNDSESVVKAWMNSPTHRDNILNAHYKEIGLAVVNGTLNGVETTLVVQVFGTPSSESVAERKESPKPKIIPKIGEASMVEAIEKEARGEEKQSSLLSPFKITKIIALFLLGIILGALILDAILVYHYKVFRISGRNIAHLIFVGMLLLAVILTTPGAIL